MWRSMRLPPYCLDGRVEPVIVDVWRGNDSVKSSLLFPYRWSSILIATRLAIRLQQFADEVLTQFCEIFQRAALDLSCTASDEMGSLRRGFFDVERCTRHRTVLNIDRWRGGEKTCGTGFGSVFDDRARWRRLCEDHRRTFINQEWIIRKQIWSSSNEVDEKKMKLTLAISHTLGASVSSIVTSETSDTTRRRESDRSTYFTCHSVNNSRNINKVALKLSSSLSVYRRYDKHPFHDLVRLISKKVYQLQIDDSNWSISSTEMLIDFISLPFFIWQNRMLSAPIVRNQVES